MSTVPAEAPTTSGWGTEHAHDPTVVRDDAGGYWMFSTDAYADGPVRGGVQVRRSDDLVDWTFHGWALDDVPAAARELTGASGLWAPEVVHVEGEWRMYWSASTFGSRTSAIGLATAAHPGGPWTDRGIVVTSTHDGIGAGSPHGDGPPNAIDANVVVDDGRHWLVYGSFFGGIHALELDPATGLALGDAPGLLLARRPADVEGAVEGAFVLPRPGGGWAMLASYDSLLGTYHVRAGVAEHVTGPYVDRAGRDLRDDADAGTVVLAGHQLPGVPGVLAPGHGAVLADGGRLLFVHHARDVDDPTRHRAQVRLLGWTADGWPAVSLLPWAGSGHELDPAPVDESVLGGTWQVVDLAAAPREAQPTARSVLDVQDVRVVRDGRLTWTWGDGASASAVVLPATDPGTGAPTWTFTAFDDRGRTVVGVREVVA